MFDPNQTGNPPPPPPALNLKEYYRSVSLAVPANMGRGGNLRTIHLKISEQAPSNPV